MEAIIIILLSVITVSAISYCLMLKRDIEHLEKTLKDISGRDTNLLMTTRTFDRNIQQLCTRMNTVLKAQSEIMRKNEKNNLQIKKTITNVSHDLRTPLTSVVGYVQMLKSDKTPPEKKEEYLTVIDLRLKALTGLLEELFEFTKIMEGHTEYNMDKVNICNVTMDTITAFYDNFQEKGITPEIDIPQKAVYSYCDAGMLGRILQNLTKNAIQHGMSKFSVRVNPRKPEIIFANDLKDSKEIDPELLFDRFYTTDASRTNKNTGLGLAIVKELVERMEGKVNSEIADNQLFIRIEFKPFCH